MDDRTEAMLERLADSMSVMMQGDPDWRDQASGLTEMLDRSGIETQPEGETPRAWCSDLFQTPGLAILAETAIAMEVEPEDFTRPIDLLVLLLPSDHHLD